MNGFLIPFYFLATGIGSANKNLIFYLNEMTVSDKEFIASHNVSDTISIKEILNLAREYHNDMEK